MKVRIDASARTFVAICACGWRDVALSNAAAWSAARRHEKRAHPGDTDTRSGLNAATRRDTP